MRLQFTDILGINKNVEIPSSQFEKALDGDIMFDGSSIEGFVRIEESDMLLAPDLDTFLVFPWGDAGQSDLPAHLRHQHARTASRSPAIRAARSRRVLAKAKSMGFTMNAGMEAEFFLFKPRRDRARRARRRTTSAATSIWRRWTWAKTRAARSSTRSSAWASRSRRRTTKSRTASTRSTSATPTR